MNAEEKKAYNKHYYAERAEKLRFKALEHYHTHRKDQIDRVALAALEEAGAVDPGDKQESLPLNDAAETPAEDEPNLTERAFQIVNALPESVTVRRIDVGMKMRKDGYVPNGKNFPVTLFKTLIRLKDQGRIGGEKRGGIWEFFAVK